MTFSLTIAGVAQQLQAGSLHISETSNGRTTASFSILSQRATYRPALDAEVLITENGTRIFGGLIDRPAEQGLFQGSTPAITTGVSAVDFSAYTERRYVNEVIPSGSLKAALIVLTTYLAGYGVTLHGSQVTGPTLPDLTYVYRPLPDVLNEFVTLTADVGEPYVWSIDAFKVLRMFQPSTVAAPFNLIGDNLSAYVIGDIEVEYTREHYANRVIVIVPPKTEMSREESFVGDGTTDTFTLQYTLTGHRGYVTSGGIYETLTTIDFVGTATWTYDPATNTIKRETGAPGVGVVSTINFDGTFSATGIAEDAGEIAANGIRERVVSVENVPSDATAQSLADSYLAQFLPVTKTVKYQTRRTGLAPDQVQTMTIPSRNLSATARITDVETRDYGPNGLVREIKALIDAETNVGRGWRDTYKAWLGDKTGGSAAAVSVGTGTIVQIGPGGPTTAVQFNRDGVFGGDGDFTYLEAANSLICGGGGSSITAADHESCQVFGYDNHIVDP